LIAAEVAAKSRAETARVVRHAVASDEAVESSRVERLARKLTQWVRAEPGQTRRELSQRLGYRTTRPLLDEALALAAQHGWIVERSEPGQGEERRALHPGEARP
jgi:hypothetical protein